MEIFFEEIKKIKEEYNTIREKNRFNIFYALHKQNDEVYLHSRFISYLLASDSGHGKKELFANLFFKHVLNKYDYKFLKDYIVIPNEYSKKEFEEIDVLLYNIKTKEAIIIENKIYARDSNYDNKIKGYNGQLERYYNTLLKGIPVTTNGETTYIEHPYKSKQVDIVYLTLKNPNNKSFEISKGSIAEKNIRIIYYHSEIIKWLNVCINELKPCEEDKFLIKIINQYLILVKNMTNNNISEKEINELRSIVSENLDSAKYFMDNYNHVKWHTVDSFFIELEKKLKNHFNEVYIYPIDYEERGKLITQMTFYNKIENISLTFQTKESKKKLYISSYNNLSWGIVDDKWKNFNDDKLENIIFSSFETKNTFDLIKNENIEKAINLIIDEIIKEEKNNFINCNNR